MKVAALLVIVVGCALARTPVWIDCDPSVAPGGHEVDDGLALIQAFHSAELEVRGVSVVFGNAPLAQGYPIAERLMRDLDAAAVPLLRGAATADELGRETDASRGIAEALRREPLTIVMIGPATNVATVLKNHPELRGRVKRLLAVAGRRPGQRFRASPGAAPFRDLNFESDVHAFQVLIDSGIPLFLLPWEISSKVWIQSGDLDRLRSAPRFPQWVANAATDWLAFWRTDLGAVGFNPFDTLAVGYAVSSDGFGCERVQVAIRNASDDTVSGPEARQKPYLYAAKNVPSARYAVYCSEPPRGFHDTLVATLSGR